MLQCRATYRVDNQFISLINRLPVRQTMDGRKDQVIDSEPRKAPNFGRIESQSIGVLPTLPPFHGQRFVKIHLATRLPVDVHGMLAFGSKDTRNGTRASVAEQEDGVFGSAGECEVGKIFKAAQIQAGVIANAADARQ